MCISSGCGVVDIHIHFAHSNSVDPLNIPPALVSGPAAVTHDSPHSVSACQRGVDLLNLFNTHVLMYSSSSILILLLLIIILVVEVVVVVAVAASLH